MTELTRSDLDRLTLELAGFARTGLPMPEGLKHLAKSAESGSLRRLSESAALAVEKGRPLSEALAEADPPAPEDFLAMVRCAERSGDMNSMLAFAVQHGRRLKRHRGALATALTYPALMLTACILVVLFIANFVLPRFVDIFRQLGAELPVLSAMFVSVLGFFQSIYGLALALIFVYLLIIPLFRERLRDLIVSRVAALPGFAPLAAVGDVAVYTKFLAVMLPRGVPLTDALSAARLAVSLPETRRALDRMSNAAERGQPIGELLGPLTPATAAHLIRQGETNGNLADACGAVADYCEERFDRVSKQMLAIFEPLLIIFLSLFIAAFVIAMYLPLFSIPRIIMS